MEHERPDEAEPGGNDIPDNLRVARRGYTLSPEALEARRRNARQSTGPKSPEGKAASARNSWKHGLYASTRVLQFARPCKTTCPKYPCAIVDDGNTRPGHDCLDKEHLVEAVMAIDRALKEQNFDDLQNLVAFELGQIFTMIRRLVADVLDDNVLMRSEKLNKDGEVIGHEYKLHPALLALPKLLSDFGLTLPDFRLTPKERQRSQDIETGARTMAEILSLATRKADQAKQ